MQYDTRRSGASTPLLVSNPTSGREFYRHIGKKILALRATYNGLIGSVKKLKYITHEIETILNNFYIADSAATDLLSNLAKKDMEKLPLVTKTAHVFVPRLYSILSDFLMSTDCVIEREALTVYIEEYQRKMPLSTRELDLLPAMLKFILLEHLDEMMAQFTVSMHEYREAEEWFAFIVKHVKRGSPAEFSSITRQLSKEYTIVPVNIGFYLIQRLSQHGSEMRFIIKWLKLNLLKQGVRIKDLEDVESNRRSASTTTINNIVVSLHWLNQARWEEFFKEVNVVDKILRADPARAYGAMDAASQASYREVVLEVEDRTGIHESEIARTVVRLAQASDRKQKDPVKSHVGYYLVDDGREALEESVGYKRSLSEKLKYFIKGNARLYVGTFIALTLVMTLGTLLLLPWGTASWTISVIFVLALFLILTDVSSSILATLVGLMFRPRLFPKLDLSTGIPDELATCVVVPSMFRTPQSFANLLKNLEVNFTGNNYHNVSYALLMDFSDAKAETLPEDDDFVELAEEGIAELNKKYASEVPRFFLLYRKRIWNEAEGVFMGYERKRGKLHEWNLLLQGKETSYINPPTLPKFRYIITLDEDTRMPREGALKLIGAIGHPLNQPVYDEVTKRVVRGYGVVQPLITTTFSAAKRSRFTELFSAAVGVDSYANASADLYQDLFGSGIFFGKGIYDPYVFERATRGEIPENTVLSHDLLEGLYIRAGFASDIQLVENFPPTYYEFMTRLERWIRGDWQIISWVNSKRFTLIDHWKIVDNIRRTIVPIALTIFVIATFSFISATYQVWMVALVIILGFPYITPIILDVLRRLYVQPNFYNTYKALGENFVKALVQIALRALSMFHQATASLKALLTALVRMFITHRKLLEWRNSHEVALKARGTLREAYFTMRYPLALSVLLLVLLARVEAPLEMALWPIAWFLAPLCIYLLNRESHEKSLSIPDQDLLKLIACRTSRFFLNNTNDVTRWLMPDHVQEEPHTRPQWTTSPTNLGMQVVSLLVSFDLGHIGMQHFVDRGQKFFRSLQSLERSHGHFYNWYDVSQGASISPKYVSSVDSANFLISLLTFRRGVEDVSNQLIITKRAYEGLLDTVRTLTADCRQFLIQKHPRDLRKVVALIIKEAVEIEKLLISPDHGSLEAFTTLIDTLADRNERVKNLLTNPLLHEVTDTVSEIRLSARHFDTLIGEYLSIISNLLPFTRIRRHRPIISTIAGDSVVALYNDVVEMLDLCPSLRTLADGSTYKAQIVQELERAVEESRLDGEDRKRMTEWLKEIQSSLVHAQTTASNLLAECQMMIESSEQFFEEADFAFFYNKERGLFRIGYNATFDRFDDAHYNFLMSEANIISFIAITKGQVPLKQWSYLGRKLVWLKANVAAPMSWGGSLFEYLMPLLFYRVHKDSMLGLSARTAITAHRQYAPDGTPWGMGESAYNVTDMNHNYQYQIFGHPHLGLKRDLANYLVVAPYTTAMSLLFYPKQAMSNLRLLMKQGGFGKFGFYDAIDYLDSAGARREVGTPTKIYYAHHQGFIMLALCNALHDNYVKKLFHADPRVRASETLLEERMSATRPVKPTKNLSRLSSDYFGSTDYHGESKHYIPTHTRIPYQSFLSNGNYAVSISNSGGGMSTYQGIQLTRFRDDPVLEQWGTFIYLFDEDRKDLWSPTYKPVNKASAKNKILYSENKATFTSRERELDVSLEVTVSATDNVEIRQLTLSNTGRGVRNISVASYGEVALSFQAQDLHHSMFQRMMVASEYDESLGALIYWRRDPRDRNKKLYFAHFTTKNPLPTTVIRERESFLGRYGTVRQPAFVTDVKASGSNFENPEYTLDPVFSIKKRLTIKSGQTLVFSYMSAVADSKDALIKIIKTYRRKHIPVRTLASADGKSTEFLRNLGLSSHHALSFQELASRLLASNNREENEFIEGRTEPLVHSLWRLGISGDRPILVVKISDINDTAIVKQLLLCHEYFIHKGIMVDMVFFNTYPVSYIKTFEDEVDFLIRYHQSEDKNAGNVYHVRAGLASPEDKQALLFIARVVIDSAAGPIDQQVSIKGRSTHRHAMPALLIPTRSGASHTTEQNRSFDTKNLYAWNGMGGFDISTGEYVMRISSMRQTPAPWVNIIANRHAGFMQSEAGAGFTWTEDSYDNRLTSWNSDPSLYRSAELLYLRDEETGKFWSPTPMPVRDNRYTTVRHGQGYTSYEGEYQQIKHVLKVFVPENDPVKIWSLDLTNTGTRERKISFTSFFELVVGVSRDYTKRYLKIERAADNSIHVRNTYTNEFVGSIVFIDQNGGNSLVSNDRNEFFGKGSSPSSPVALTREKLGDAIYDGVDSCVTLQSVVTIKAGESKNIVLMMGSARTADEISRMVRTYRSTTTMNESFRDVTAFWNNVLSAVTIDTPDQSLNVLFNKWLLYQALSARIFGKTGYYQPSGAYGFRDQLQDSMAFVHSYPTISRELLLKASARQFKEGDVENWWHEHNGFGIRTVFSDQQLWLPYVALHYVNTTGDRAFLDEMTPFVEMPPEIAHPSFDGQHEWAGMPATTKESYSIYEHCARAIDKTLLFGPHRLPLIGLGDWNDGFNNVGVEGKGESIWLGWFLSSVMNSFIPYARERGDMERAERYERIRDELKGHLNTAGWDGEWYRRAYFDDGAVLGAANNREARIDVIAQAWSVLSGAGEGEKSTTAMAAVEKELIQKDNLLHLLDPAFTDKKPDPGYIADYPPGVRENGAQYNHAALWAVQAFSMIGNTSAAKKVLDSINPVHRSGTLEDALKYRVEPYVVASDIYTNPAYSGRGGWTWYTGSAGVMYRTILEYVLGVRRVGNKLVIKPALPEEWPSATVRYTFGKSVYVLSLTNNKKEMEVELVDDGKEHQVNV